MKPIKLSMTGFGAYARTQVIDFAELGQRSFFLISGPTGSGKTTILDAICFALYGVTSGNIRQGKQMRSDYADNSTTTEVTFEFGLAGQRFKVSRTPQQQRLKRWGEGTTTQQADATLWDITRSEAKVLATGVTDVTGKVEQLLGFKCDQFRQVVLLPQGDFRKLLLANSRERQEIMTTLFKTQYYGIIEAKLKETANSLARDVEKLKDIKLERLKIAECETVAELKKRYQQHLALSTQLAQQLTIAQSEEKLANNNLKEGQQMQDKVVEKEAAQHELQQLMQQENNIDCKKQQLQWATKAASLIDLETILSQRKQESNDAQQALKDVGITMAQAASDAAEAQSKLNIEEEKASHRSELQKQLANLAALEEKVIKLQEMESEVNKATATMIRAENAHHQILEQHGQLKRSIVTLTEKKEAALAHAAKEPQLNVAVNEISKTLSKKKEFEQVRGKLEQVKNASSAAKMTLDKCRREYQAAKDIMRDAQLSWNKGQAAVLAGTLTADAPCPVCGSHSHPSPAREESGIPSSEDLKKYQLAVDKFEEQVDNNLGQLNRLLTEAATLEAKAAELSKDLGDKVDIEVQQLEREAQQLAKKLKDAQASKRLLDTLTNDLDTLNKQEELCGKRLTDAEGELSQHKDRLLTAQALLVDKEAGIPKNLRSQEAVRAAVKQVEQELKSSEEAYKHAVNLVNDANQLLAAAKTALANSETAASQLAEKAQSEQKHFDQRLTEAGFNNRAEYTAAKLSVNEVTQLEKLITQFNNNLSSAKQRALRATEMAKGLEMPDMDLLLKKADLAATHKENILAQLADVKKDAKQESSWLDDLDKMTKRILQLEERYYTLGKLAEVANGKNNFGITLERFILGALLDDVLIAASQRLNLMSKGRYQLRRTLDRARRNAQGGLELEVFDNYTGANRHVSTLSGGETFLASLSLALGLADVVQAYSGGIHLDTIFVDEGFGTLDAETLDFAITTLIDLQKGGRLVGIISHVSELKERIDARLEVTLTDKGSAAAFIIS